MGGRLLETLKSDDAKRPAAGASPKMIDVQGMLRQASKRVSVEQLVQQGLKYIAVLSKEKIDELINQAVKNIADKYRSIAAGFAPAEMEGEAKAEFNELLQTYRQSVKAKSDIEQSKEALAQELEELGRMADGRDAEQALQLGFQEFERELGKQVDKVFEQRRLILQESGSPEAVEALKGVEIVLRPLIARLLKAERERFGTSRETAMMEKRIEKLYAQIQALESALKTITSSKVYSNQQIQNILRQLGLTQEDKNYEKKREMLKVVLSANQDIRRQVRTLEEKGVTLARPEGLEAALKAGNGSP